MLKQATVLLMLFQVFAIPSVAAAEQNATTQRTMMFAQANKDQCRAACTNQMMRCRANCPQGASYESCRQNCASGGQACQNRC